MIKSFQSKNGLVADGILGQQTFDTMFICWGFSNRFELVHFLAQTHHETGGFKIHTENLKYSPKRLKEVFPKYFSVDEVFEYSYNEEKIANRVYANRMGNGNEASGDGYKYRGRGSIQLTGFNNYERFAQKIRDFSILDNPDKVATDYFWDAGLFYFNENNLWSDLIDLKRDTVKKLTKAINGGYNGLQDRINLTEHYGRFI